MRSFDDPEQCFRQAIQRAYRSAGVALSDFHADSLAGVYARWAPDADAGVVARVEAKLTRSLGAPHT